MPTNTSVQYISEHQHILTHTPLLDLFGTVLPLEPVHPDPSVQLLAECPELSISVLHVGSNLFQSLHSIAAQLLPAAGLLGRLMPGHLELLCLCIIGYLVNSVRLHLAVLLFIGLPAFHFHRHVSPKKQNVTKMWVKIWRGCQINTLTIM